MTIAKIPPEKHESIVHDIQWAIRNMYKDIGFTRSDAARQNIRNSTLAEIETIIAEHEDLSTLWRK